MVERCPRCGGPVVPTGITLKGPNAGRYCRACNLATTAEACAGVP